MNLQTQLKKSTLFKFLDDQAINKLAQDAIEYKVSKNRILVERGDQVSGIYFVIAGELRIFNIDSDGKDITLYELSAGDACVLAMSSAFSGMPYPANVAVISAKAHVLVFPASTYKSIYLSDEAARDVVFNTLSTTVIQLLARIDELSLLSVEERISRFIERKINHGETISITHEELAQKIGTTREVASRILSKLNQHSIIKTGRGKITRL